MEKQNSNYRWIVFIFVLLSYLLAVSQRTAPGLISDQLMKEFNVTASTIGLLTSIQFMAYAGLQVPIGIFSDRFGPNYFLIIGTLLNGFGTVVYSLAPNETVLLIARLMVGMGDSTLWINLVLILSGWFKVKEFISLLGVAGMVGSLGFLMATVPFSAWIAIAGWREPFFVTGILLCLCGIANYFVLITKPKQMQFAERKKAGKDKEKREKVLVTLKRVFSERQSWAVFLCHFGVVGTYVGFVGSWAVPYGMHVYDMSRSGASQLIMVGLIGAIIGAPLVSWISGRLQSVKRPYIVVHIVVLLSWLTFLLFNGKPPFFMLVILFFLIGFGNGASALTFVVVREYFPIKVVGVVSGVANTGGFLSAILLPIIFGSVLDHFHQAPGSAGYFYGLLIPAIFAMIGLIGGILIKEQREAEKQTTHSMA